MTCAAATALENAHKVLARTSQTPAFGAIERYSPETLDGIFLSSRNFDTLNKKLAKAVLNAAKEGDVCYCVDGAVSEDEACKIIMKRGKNVEICEGVSRISAVKNAAKIKSSSVCALSSYAIDELKSCPAAIVYDIDDEYAASTVKQKLTDVFGEETVCSFVRGNEAKKIRVYEIDRQKKYDLTCAVAIEEGEFLKKDRYDFSDLERMIRLLRAPGGCPWDRVQTNESIRQNMIEEAYELVDAINRGDDAAICEETGDVLLQAAFHAVLKEEQGAFNSRDALTGVVKKLIFRHSHIFGKDKATDEKSALEVWEKNKSVEKSQSTYGEKVAAVPVNFPACMRAQKVQKRAAKSGMDYLSSASAADGLFDEVKELISALSEGNADEIEEEAGDVLFSAVNVARLAGVDCEQALSRAVDKFSYRFIKWEQLVIADGKKVEELDGQDRDWYWLQAKGALNAEKKD